MNSPVETGSIAVQYAPDDTLATQSFTVSTMRILFVVLLAASPFLPLLAGCASMGMGRVSADTPQEVETIVEHSQAKEDAFNRLQRWVAETYVSANDVIQLNDEEAGTLVVRGATEVRHAAGSHYYKGYTMTIDVRDNRVRFLQRFGEPIGGGAYYLSQSAADDMLNHFAALRASALTAMNRVDGF